jgi:hypothetical protein
MQQQTPVTVTSTATPILASRANRGAYILHNNSGATTVFLGSATVTAANGIPLAAGEKIAVDRSTGSSMVGDALYGITSAGTAEVRVATGAS